MLKLLKSYNCDILTVEDKEQETPLFYAISKKHFEIVKYLDE
jgi:ankyrin repeat protein